jgi:hypothetical protein
MRWARSVAALAVAASCGETSGTLVTTGTPGIWQPAPTTTWQVQLTGTLDTSLDVALYDVDLFDTSTGDIQGLHAAGRRVICYVSVGTFEPWRSDASSFPAAALGNPLSDYPNERWLDSRDGTVRSLMTARLDLAMQKQCDGVDLSNLSPDGSDSGFSLARTDVLDYGRRLTADAHGRGLAAGLGGGADVAADLEPGFQWALTNGCLAAGNCGAFASFQAARKVVFAVEFGTAADAPTICPRARQASLNTLIKNRSYDAFRVACD